MNRLRAIDTSAADRTIAANRKTQRGRENGVNLTAPGQTVRGRVSSDVTDLLRTNNVQKKSTPTLAEGLKRSWDVAADYAKTGKLNTEKVKEAAANKVDLIGASKSLLTGAAKSTGAGMVNAGGTVLQGLDSGTVSGKSRDELVAAPKPQTVQQLYQTADRLADSANKDIAIARETLGDLVTDVGVGLVQLGGDVAVGMLVPGGAMASMMTRSFGGKAQEVRRKGGSIDAQVSAGATAAVTEFLLEKMFSVGKFQSE